MTYCQFCKDLPADNPNKYYHDKEYGFPLDNDNDLFNRLVLEINQAGLSWNTILNKRYNFEEAFDQFNIQKVANYTEEDRVRLLSNAGIIRNKLKINAAIYNANAILKLQESHSSFHNWILSHGENDMKDWVKIFKKPFKFVGGEIVKEFLQSTGYIETPHDKDCPVYAEIKALKPKQ
ncbi:MAG: DNA-3-methyladenine glycosylase I [Saprospiraceae bacterium]